MSRNVRQLCVSFEFKSKIPKPKNLWAVAKVEDNLEEVTGSIYSGIRTNQLYGQCEALALDNRPRPWR
jgi:hypothetical protein